MEDWWDISYLTHYHWVRVRSFSAVEGIATHNIHTHTQWQTTQPILISLVPSKTHLDHTNTHAHTGHSSPEFQVQALLSTSALLEVMMHLILVRELFRAEQQYRK